jgi:chorismate dehydratase
MIKAGIAKIRVVAVSYLNTVPFIYGMDYSAFSNLIDLRLGNPLKCFQLFQKGDADIALVPVGSLPMIGKCNIITPHCIGADGNVGSVFLLSDSPAEKIKTIYCDLHSVTSNKLVEILCRDYWKISPVIRYPDMYPPEIQTHDAIIAIGDKSFKMLKSYKYHYDLSQIWKNMTNLPFVFAVWVTKSDIHPTLLKGFNEALTYGVQNIHASIEYCQPGILPVDEIVQYLKFNVIHVMNDSLKEGLFHFLNFIYPEFRAEIKLI